MLWCGLIFYLSGIPHLKTELGYWDIILRKLAHLAEYGILSFLTMRALLKSVRMSVAKAVLVSAIFCVLYAVSDEFHQKFVPGRGPSVIDVFIDSMGVFFVSIMYYNKIKKLEINNRNR